MPDKNLYIHNVTKETYRKICNQVRVTFIFYSIGLIIESF